jgi:hypothetical protein
MAQLSIARGHDLEHQVGSEGGGVAADGGTYGSVGAVRNACANAGTGLHRDLMALANQFLDGFWRGGYPRFAGMGFERNTDVHVKSPA